MEIKRVPFPTFPVPVVKIISDYSRKQIKINNNNLDNKLSHIARLLKMNLSPRKETLNSFKPQLSALNLRKNN
jgi:hypothetical protein